MVAMQSHLDAC